LHRPVFRKAKLQEAYSYAVLYQEEILRNQELVATKKESLGKLSFLMNWCRVAQSIFLSFTNCVMKA
jgi:hypothetical protein